jgi:hypothetical protein
MTTDKPDLIETVKREIKYQRVIPHETVSKLISVIEIMRDALKNHKDTCCYQCADDLKEALQKIDEVLK